MFVHVDFAATTYFEEIGGGGLSFDNRYSHRRGRAKYT